MSARRFRSRAGAETAAAPSETQRPLSASRKRLLKVAFVLSLVWSLSLLAMVLLTGNVQLVSHDQILRADLVVVARRTLPGDDRVKVERVLHGDAAAGDELRVVDATDLAGMADDRDYVLALSNSRGGYAVTRLGNGQQVPPLIYRATPELIAAVKAICRDRQ